MGFLVRKPFSGEIYSHRHLRTKSGHRISRDVVEFRLLLSDKPIAVFLGVHLKSKLDMKKTDYLGLTQREKEVELLKKVYEQTLQKFPETPIFISGDFNAILVEGSREAEFISLFSVHKLVDILEVLDLDIEERTTHLFFDRFGHRKPSQLDYILFSPKYSKNIDKKSSGLYAYKNNYGDKIQVDNLKDKLDLPSDHFPLYMRYKI